MNFIELYESIMCEKSSDPVVKLFKKTVLGEFKKMKKDFDKAGKFKEMEIDMDFDESINSRGELYDSAYMEYENGDGIYASLFKELEAYKIAVNLSGYQTGAMELEPGGAELETTAPQKDMVKFLKKELGIIQKTVIKHSSV